MYARKKRIVVAGLSIWRRTRRNDQGRRAIEASGKFLTRLMNLRRNTMDERIKLLAGQLVSHSMRVKEGEKVLIHCTGYDTEPLGRALVKAVYEAKGIPLFWLESPRIQRELLLNCSEEQLKLKAQADCLTMSAMDCYVAVRGSDNTAELSDVPAERMELFNKVYHHPVHNEIRVPKTRWVVLRYPSPSMAQAANTSLEAFEDFYFDVCCLDYDKMKEAVEPLRLLMERTDQVRIVGNGTDLTFSIKGIPAVPCCGEMNIPDGEIYTAPVRDSVNGVLCYNTPSQYQGFVYENICLTFENGKIVNAEANDTRRINKVFDTDEGARYVGEFAIGINPYVLTPMKDTLFDEKIMGSFHFTPGNCYDEAPNGNSSAIHWDLVCIQTPEWGGGEIWFDGVLVRKDGRFVLPELQGLNPEELKK